MIWAQLAVLAGMIAALLLAGQGVRLVRRRDESRAKGWLMIALAGVILANLIVLLWPAP